MDDIDRARLLLRLPIDYGYEALDEAYHRAAAASLTVPVDARDTLLASLNVARDLLADALGPRVGTDLVVRTATPLIPLEALTQEAARQRTEASNRAVRAVVTRQVGRLAHLRRQRFTTGVVLGALGAIGFVVRFLSSSNSDSVISTSSLTLVSSVLAALGALFGILGWKARTNEAYLTFRIEELADALTDRALLADLMDSITTESEWTRQEFRDAVAAWTRNTSEQVTGPDRPDETVGAAILLRYIEILRNLGFLTPPDSEEPLWRMASRIGATDFASVVLAKGIETGLVEEALLQDGVDRARYGYRRGTPPIRSDSGS